MSSKNKTKINSKAGKKSVLPASAKVNVEAGDNFDSVQDQLYALIQVVTHRYTSLHIVAHRCTSLHIVTHRDQDQLYALIRASAYRHVPLLAVHAHSHARAQPPSERDQRQLR